MTAATQKARVLKLLRRAGRRGITQLDADRPADGGPPIRRLAARISDLKDLGYVVESRTRRRKFVVYTLVREPATAAIADDKTEREEPAALFSPAPPPPSSPLDPRSDA